MTHWIGAAAMLGMIFSGWAIYNASPLLPFLFPRWATLGGWLAGGIAWHLTALWVLLADGLVYIVWGFASGHFRRDFWPVTGVALRRDLLAALRLRLAHRVGVYNAVQRAAYIAVLAAALLAVASGLAIWKPVQLGPLAWALGGYDVARRLHFAAMVAIVLFVLLHLALVAIVPATLPGMLWGRRRVRP